MPGVDEAISTGLKLALEIVHILNPSELDKLKRQIRKQEKRIADNRKALIKAVKDGDVDAINLITFRD